MSREPPLRPNASRRRQTASSKPLLLARSADADISTRAVSEAAAVTAPTTSATKGLLSVVVDFDWAAFLKSKRTTAAVVHVHVADDIRAVDLKPLAELLPP